MKTITLPKGYRFRRNWRGKMILQRLEPRWDMGPYTVWIDVKANDFLDEERVQVKWV